MCIMGQCYVYHVLLSINCEQFNLFWLEKDRVFKDLTGLHEEIKNIRKDMEASAATGRTLKSTTAWKNLQKSYCSDVKVNNILCHIILLWNV